MKKIILMVLLAFVAGSVQASLDGRDMNGVFYFPTLNNVLSTDSWTVGPGVEVSGFPSGDPRTDLDVSANNIQMTFTSSSSWTNAEQNGPVFNVLSVGEDISGVSINPATDLVGFDMSRVSWTPTSITINWQSLAFNTDEVISLDVAFGAVVGTETTPVPSLNKLGLMLLAGLLLVVGVLRTRRNPTA